MYLTKICSFFFVVFTSFFNVTKSASRFKKLLLNFDKDILVVFKSKLINCRLIIYCICIGMSITYLGSFAVMVFVNEPQVMEKSDDKSWNFVSSIHDLKWYIWENMSNVFSHLLYIGKMSTLPFINNILTWIYLKPVVQIFTQFFTKFNWRSLFKLVCNFRKVPGIVLEFHLKNYRCISPVILKKEFQLNIWYKLYNLSTYSNNWSELEMGYKTKWKIREVFFFFRFKKREK